MPSKAITAATTHFLQFRIQYASITLLWYDYALTLPREIRYIWGQKIRLSTILYIFCRYALLANVLYLLAVAGKLHTKVCTIFCNIWYKLIGALSVLGRAAVIVVFTARTYAIFARSRLILAFLGTIGLACFILDIMHVPGLRCKGSSTIPIANTLLSILMTVFEFCSAILTTFRSIQAFRVSGPWKTQKGGFLYLVFEQGILYFLVMSVLTTAAVILNFRAPAGFFQRLLNALILPVSGLLTARFLLHLRAWEYKQTNGVQSKTGARSQARTMPDFQVAERLTVVSSVMDEFGEDPVVREKKRAAVDQPIVMDSWESGSHEGVMSPDIDEEVEFQGTVKEGKRPVIAAV